MRYKKYVVEYKIDNGDMCSIDIVANGISMLKRFAIGKIISDILAQDVWGTKLEIFIDSKCFFCGTFKGHNKGDE